MAWIAARLLTRIRGKVSELHISPYNAPLVGVGNTRHTYLSGWGQKEYYRRVWPSRPGAGCLREDEHVGRRTDRHRESISQNGTSRSRGRIDDIDREAETCPTLQSWAPMPPLRNDLSLGPSTAAL